MMRFTIRPHTEKPDVQMVEVWLGNTFVGALYPSENGCKFVSKYLETATVDETFPPTVEILLDTTIVANRTGQ